MPTYPYATKLAEQLSSMLGHVPDTVDVLQLAQPDVGTVQQRLAELIGDVGKVAGLGAEPAKIETQKVRSVARLPGRLHATGFHASGAMSVRLDLAPFDDLFESDPGDEELAALTQRAAADLQLEQLVPDGDKLSFERLWRIRAAAGDQKGTMTDPVLCRAVGSFRHTVGELPVYGRASAAVEVAAAGKLTSVSVALRRFARDGGGEVFAKARVRKPGSAALDVSNRLVKAFAGADNLRSTHLVAEWFRFGYLSMGRRQAQGLLAPFYIASVRVERKESEASAHVIAVPGSDEQFVRLPSGHRASAARRLAAAV